MYLAGADVRAGGVMVTVVCVVWGGGAVGGCNRRQIFQTKLRQARSQAGATAGTIASDF